MRKIFLAIISIISLISYCQERVNTPIQKFEKTGVVFKQNFAIKYNYNEEQKTWVEDKNHKFHFKTLQFKSFSCNGKLYYLLIKKYRHSGYVYPNIREGYVEYDKTSALIFSEDEYNKIIQFKTGVSKYREIEDYENDKELINKAIYNIEKNTVYEYTYFLLKKENESKIRFLLYKSYDKVENYNPDIFKNLYFESDITNFNQLISI